MRILIYSLNFYPELTGIGKYSWEMSEWLNLKGHEVRVVTALPYYPEWKIHSDYRKYSYKTENIDGVKIFRSPLWVPSLPSAIKRILHLMSYAVLSFPVLFKNIFWKPDVIITIEPPIFSLPGSLLLSFFSRSKTLLHIQDYEIDAAFELGMMHSKKIRTIISGVEIFYMRRFTRISSISPNMVKRAIEKGVNENDVVLFPNWVDTKNIYPLKNSSSYRKEFNIHKNKVIALYSGNMGEKQGLEIIIETAQQLKLNANIQFVMCGSGAAYKRLRKLAINLDNILWLPLQPLEKLNDLLNFADIHLLPQSKNIADLVMPSKLTGILASGKPVVATAMQGTQLAEVVEGKGLVVPPDSLKEFSDAINELANMPDKRVKLGLSAREYAVKYLDREVVMSKFELNLFDMLNNT